MTDKLSEVARAIANATYDDKAKAAIEAYRDPTDEMVEAVQIAIGGKLSWGLIETILRAGADAALEEK